MKKPASESGLLLLINCWKKVFILLRKIINLQQPYTVKRWLISVGLKI
jgi:hypothetical protein